MITKKTKQRTVGQRPEAVQLTVVITPEGVEAAERRIAKFKTKLRQQAREELDKLAADVRGRAGYTSEAEVMVEADQTVRDVRVEMRSERHP